MKDTLKAMPLRRTALSVLVALGCFSVSPLQAQEAQENAAEEEEIEKVEVTGSRIKRSELEGPQSLVVISSEDMSARGEVTVFDALKNLSQNSTFQFEGPESQLFTPDVQTINLRGIGVGNTLVLINGRRATNYPAAYQSNTSVFNFGAIPTAAVERIEILSTGASAIYGSDAVAGVVNIILKKDVEDTTINVMLGTPTETKSSKYTSRLEMITGKTFEKGNITGIFQYQKREGIQGKDLEAYDDQEEDFPYGQGVRDRAVLNLNWFNHYFRLGDRYVDPGEGTCEGMNNDTRRSNRPGAGYFCGYDGVRETNFRNDSESYSLFLDGNYNLDNGVSLFGNFLYYGSEGKSNNDYLWISEDIYDTDSDPIGWGHDWYLAQRYFTEQELGMNLDQTFEDDSFAGTIGARGQIWDSHDWELAVAHSSYEMNSKRPWWKAEAVIDTFLGDFYGFGYVGNEWWSGEGSFGLKDNLYAPATADVSNAVGYQTYGNKTSSTNVQFLLNGDMMDLPAGPLSYAFVLEYEKQDMELIPDERITQNPPIEGLTGSGWWKLTGYQGKGERTRTAMGLEMRFPVVETVTANVAARVDNYDSTSSSIGTKVTPSVSVEYRPTDSFLARAGYSGSFRAPDMNYVFTDSGGFTGAVDLVGCYETYVFQNGTDEGFNQADCDSTTVFRKRVGSQKLGEDALKDETGHSSWVGFSWDIQEDMQLTVDYSVLKLTDRVETESTSKLLRDEFACFQGDLTGSACTYVSNRIKRGVDENTGISYISEFNVTPINQSEEEIRSLDATFSYKFDTDFGDFNLRTQYSHMLAQKIKQTADDAAVDIRDDEFAGGWNPRSVLTGTLSYSNDRFGAALTGMRIGSTTTYRPSLRNPEEQHYRVAPYIRWNLTAGYEVTSNLDIGINVNNVFNQKAPRDQTFQFYDDPWYNPFIYSGAGIGREVYVNASYRF